MEERIISERIVKKKNSFLNNPITKKVGDIFKSIKLVFLGLLLVILAFVLIVVSVKSVKEISKVVSQLSLTPTEEVKGKVGLVKFKGKVETKNPLVYSFNICGDSFCFIPLEVKTYDNLLFYSAEYSRLEPVKKTKTETRTIVKDGQEVEQTIEKTYWDEEWISKKKDSRWADFYVGGVKINHPEEARIYLNKKTETFENVHLAGLSPLKKPADESFSADLGKVKLTLTYIPFHSGSEFLVVGNVNNNEVDPGDIYIITDKPEEELVSTLQTNEKHSRLWIRLIAWLLLTVGLVLMVGPFLEIMELVPFLGSFAKWFMIIAFAITSAVIVIVGAFFVKHWYLFSILVLLFIIAGIFSFNKMRSGVSKGVESLESDVANKVKNVKKKNLKSEGK